MLAIIFKKPSLPSILFFKDLGRRLSKLFLRVIFHTTECYFKGLEDYIIHQKIPEMLSAEPFGFLLKYMFILGIMMKVIAQTKRFIKMERKS